MRKIFDFFKKVFTELAKIPATIVNILSDMIEHIFFN